MIQGTDTPGAFPMPRRISLRFSRRRFLATSASLGAALYVSGGRSAAREAMDKLNVACIGVGGKGRSDSDHAAMFGNVVAICDIDETSLLAKAELMPQARKFADFRKLLDEMHGQIDAVVVSTPDHTHAAAAVAAMQLGKHVYCQKPLAHSPWEARRMREVAKEKGLATQMGNQGTADPGFRAGIELIRSGAIGPVREVVVWTNRPFKYWKQAPDLVARPAETPPIPATVDWDLFLGPAPYRPYHPVYHPHDWRGWWEFGTGALGDMACHTTNLPFMALKLGLPTRVSAVSSEVNQETYPAWSTITYEFPARGDLPAVKLTWYEGAKDGKRHLPDPSLFEGATPTDSGSLLIGEKGKLYSSSDYGSEQVLLPAKTFADLDRPEPSLERLDANRKSDENHKWEWLRACQGGPPALSNFDYSATLTEAMLLGNIAIRVGQPIEYDAAKGEVTNCPKAAPFVRPTFRDGWTVG
jgi:predicted dehydrogenase